MGVKTADVQRKKRELISLHARIQQYIYYLTYCWRRSIVSIANFRSLFAVSTKMDEDT